MHNRLLRKDILGGVAALTLLACGTMPQDDIDDMYMDDIYDDIHMDDMGLVAQPQNDADDGQFVMLHDGDGNMHYTHFVEGQILPLRSEEDALGNGDQLTSISSYSNDGDSFMLTYRKDNGRARLYKLKDFAVDFKGANSDDGPWNEVWGRDWDAGIDLMSTYVHAGKTYVVTYDKHNGRIKARRDSRNGAKGFPAARLSQTVGEDRSQMVTWVHKEPYVLLYKPSNGHTKIYRIVSEAKGLNKKFDSKVKLHDNLTRIVAVQIGKDPYLFTYRGSDSKWWLYEIDSDGKGLKRVNDGQLGQSYPYTSFAALQDEDGNGYVVRYRKDTGLMKVMRFKKKDDGTRNDDVFVGRWPENIKHVVAHSLAWKDHMRKLDPLSKRDADRIRTIAEHFVDDNKAGIKAMQQIATDYLNTRAGRDLEKTFKKKPRPSDDAVDDYTDFFSNHPDYQTVIDAFGFSSSSSALPTSEATTQRTGITLTLGVEAMIGIIASVAGSTGIAVTLDPSPQLGLFLQVQSTFGVQAEAELGVQFGVWRVPLDGLAGKGIVYEFTLEVEGGATVTVNMTTEGEAIGFNLAVDVGLGGGTVGIGPSYTFLFE